MPKTYNVTRRHTRIFFNDRDKITGLISAVDDVDSSFSSTILNLSEGGLQFNQKRTEYKGVQPGDKLLLRRFIGLHKLIPLVDLPVQIIWVMDNKYLEHVVMGASFTDLADNHRQIMQSFVNTCLALHMEKKEL